MSILDHDLISERYFFPSEDAPADPTWVDVDGARLACYATPRRHDLTVLHFHGNGEVVAGYVPWFVDWMGELEADCFLAEYRGYGASTGTPRLGKMLDDVEAIIEAVGRPADEIVVFGRSVGSIYAIETAYRFPEVAGLILESGIADPGERILLRCTPDELGVSKARLDAAFAERLDNLAKLQSRDKPTLVLHTENDHLVDVSHGERLAAAPARKARLVTFHAGDHNTIFSANREEYEEEVQRLLHRSRRSPSADDTLEGMEVREDTLEMHGSPGPKRVGPGQTTPIEIPPALRGDRAEADEASSEPPADSEE